MQDNSLHRKHFYTQTLLHTKALTHRSFYTQKLLHKRFYTQSFYPQKRLHTEAFTYRSFYTQTLLHRHFYTQTRLHADTFTHRPFYAQELLYTQTLVAKNCDWICSFWILLDLLGFFCLIQTSIPIVPWKICVKIVFFSRSSFLLWDRFCDWNILEPENVSIFRRIASTSLAKK